MPSLKSAGIIGQITSYFFPKELKAHVRSEVLPDGEIEVTPFFTIDGQEVPAESVGPEPGQTILGYRVTLELASLQVRRKTQGRRTRLSKWKASEFLGELASSGVRIRSGDGKAEPRIARVKPGLSLRLSPEDQLGVRSELTTAEGVVVEKPPSLEQLRRDEGWYSVGDDLFHLAPTGTPLDEVVLSQGEEVHLKGDDVPRFLKLLQDHRGKIAAVEEDGSLRGLAVFGDDAENCAKVDGDSESISVSPVMVFHDPDGRQREESLGDLEGFQGGGYRRVEEGWVKVSKGAILRHRRACEELGRRIGKLTGIRGTDIPKVLVGLGKAAQDGGGWKTPWSVYFSKAVKDSHRVVDSPAVVQFRLNIVESDGRSLLELDPNYNHERFQVSHAESEAATESGGGWLRRRAAWIKVDAKKFEKVAAGIDRLGLHRTDTGFRFPASEREKVIRVFSTLGSIQQSAAYADFLAKLADFQKIEGVPLPESVRPGVVLRPYQKHGYDWLAFLHRFGLNGILADDMGLGKTLQCLAIIRRAREMSVERLPSLIICPTSVVNNWRSEAYKFFEDFDVFTYTGTKRQDILRRVRRLSRPVLRDSTCVLVITSYDVARRDHELLGEVSWLYVVVDEGHNIKNPDAVRTKAIKTLNGRHKLALTGTPLQNSLEELWSLFDFAMPGFLGTRTQFRDRYGRSGKINWDEVHGGKEPLKERIKPFVLRRLKENVAKDLPPKTLVERKVELSPMQVKLYKSVIEGEDCKALFAKVAEVGVNRARPLILSAYSKLRNICNHPALSEARGGDGVVKCSESGKAECLKELMEETSEGEHRALLFCQSTKMLDIIESLLREWDVSSLRLDGSTPADRRQGLVDRFNGDTSITCFLISTRAGGTGLNLTGADTVIFYDHDWNPANDNQAQDRAHRIGQTRPVTVYKLVSRGTIEEKIIERQATKQTLADQIVGVDEEGFKELSAEQLFALFRLDVNS